MKTIKGILTFCLFALGLGTASAQNPPSLLQEPPKPAVPATGAEAKKDNATPRVIADSSGNLQPAPQPKLVDLLPPPPRGDGANADLKARLEAEKQVQTEALRRASDPQLTQQRTDGDRLAREQELRPRDEAERQKSLLRIEQELLEKHRQETTGGAGLGTPAPVQTVAVAAPQAEAAVPPPAIAAPGQPLTPEADAVARELLRKKMNELDTAPAARVPAPALLAPPPPVTSPPTLLAAAAEPSGTMTPAQESAARALLRQTGTEAAPTTLPPDWPRSKELGRGYAPNVQPHTRTVVIPPSQETRPIVIPPGATPPPPSPIAPVLTATPATSAAPITPESESSARALLRQKMAELNAGAPIAPATIAIPAPPSTPVVPAPPVVTPPATSVTVLTPHAGMTPEQEAAARDVLRAKMTEVFDTPKASGTDAEARTRAEQEKNLREASRIQVEAEAKHLAEQRQQTPAVVQPAPVAPVVSEAERSAEADRAARMARIEAEMAKRGVTVPAPTSVTAPTLITPIVPAGPLSPEQEAQAREVLRQKMAELGAPSAAVPVNAPRPFAPPPPPAAVLPSPRRTESPAPPASGLNAEQEAAAREALRRKISEMNTVAVPVAALPATPRPVVAPVAVAPPAVAVTSGLSPEQEAAARQLLRANYTEAAPVARAPIPVPAAPAAPEAALPKPIPAAVPGPLDPAADARTRELLRQKMSELTVTQPASPVDTGAEAKSRRDAEAAAKAEARSRETPPPVLKPAVPAEAGAVAPAYPKTKQQRLSELLEAYKADKITPADYHNERAKIISEP